MPPDALPTPPVAPAPAAAPAPSAVSPTPVAAPVVPPAADAAPAPAPVVASPDAVPAPAAAAGPAAAPTPAATILGTDPAKPVEGDATAKAPEPTAPEPAKEGQSATPAQPSYEPFKFPEGVTPDQDLTGAFTTLLGKFESTAKADHAAVQAFGQELVDFHSAQMQDFAQKTLQTWQQNWETTKADWGKEFTADPVWGGNNLQTTVDSAREFIRTHGGSAEEQAELRQLLESSGLGNHRFIIRTFARAMSKLKEPTAPAPATKLDLGTEKKSKIETLYGKQTKAA